MNIFFVPSWYPSESNPIYGTFIKEQIELLAHHRPAWNLGVSLWGQGDNRKLLWIRDHILNLRKYVDHVMDAPYAEKKKNVFYEYYPCLTWTKKLQKGNLRELVRVNEKNFLSFREHVETIDIINAQASYPGAIIANHLARKYHVPYSVTIRMSPFPFSEFLSSNDKLRSIIKRPLKEANLLIATSHSLKERLKLFELKNVSVIHNPVDTVFFKPTEKGSVEFSILTVGRLEEQKGIDLLIKAIAILGDEMQGKLCIGGEGSKKKAYAKLACQLGVANKIDWLGLLSRDQVAEEMKKCSFYVLSSRHETFGNVLLEAMASGKPVVATKCGGPESIVTKQTGYLCEINEKDIAEKIRLMIANRTSFTDDIIRKETENRFSPEKWADQLEDVFKKTSLFTKLKYSK